MTYCVEPFIQDLVWCWLDNNEDYIQVGGEIPIGAETNSGRIDLVAETQEGEYHGFEIKNYAPADEQLNRYRKSGYLDKLFHCSRIGDDIKSRLEKQDKGGAGTYESQQIRKEVSNAIAAGQYTEEEYRQALTEIFPDSMLHQNANITSKVIRL